MQIARPGLPQSVETCRVPLGLAAEFADLSHAIISALFDRYHPECHYMRGPGPKWHAKHDPVPASAETSPRFGRPLGACAAVSIHS